MAKSRAVIQLGLALILALGAGFFVLKWMQTKPQATVETKVEAPPTKPVVVASAILPPGTKLELEMLKAVPYLEETVPAESFNDPAEIVGRVLLSPMRVNEPITAGRLAASDVSVGGVSALINPGKRAMAVRGNKVLGLSGLVRPGNRVDVLVTLDKDNIQADADEPKTEAKLVLENILVLASGTELQPSEDGTSPSPVDVYTLEVDPRESERLALAATKGTLHFALRNSIDEKVVWTEGVNTETALDAFRIKKNKPKAAPPKPEFRAQVILGGEMNEVIF